MTTNHAACAHPIRDLMIVALSAAAVSLVAFIIITRLGGATLDGLKGAAATFAAFAGGGVAVLGYLKRN
ncbi:hypothetical protein ACFYU9_35530 [Streptomyces sp. NPDC004327]|uniref:hypothetical protein n=1 Tax=Streptomyces sp. NPDC004327 TaxID=3364699 RepID=UPI0036C1FB5F